MDSALASPTPVTLFYSYAHEDEALRDELQGHLKLLERRGLLAPWHDRQIRPGADWGTEIDLNLKRAELVLLLVSKDFIESDYIMGVELAAAMQRHATQTASVVPIIVRAVDLDPEDADVLPFLKLQGLPTDLKPVTSWANRDEAWTDVAKGLRRTVKEIRERRLARVSVVEADDPFAFLPPPVGSAPQPMAPSRAPPQTVAPSRGTPSVVAPAARAPAADPLIERLIDDIGRQIAAAQSARGAAPLAPGAVASLNARTRTLIDVREQKRVLWVDDRPEGNRFEAAALAKLQIEIVTALDTDAALQTLANDTEGFDLVISDWEREGEPAAAGLHLLARMRDAGRRIPVVYYHGGLGNWRTERAAQARAAGAFGETVFPDELFALVAGALAAGAPT